MPGTPHGGVGEWKDVDAVIDLVSILSLQKLTFPIDVPRQFE